MPAHFGWGVGSVVAEPVAGVGKRVAGRAYKEKSHFGMRMMTNFQNIFGHKLKSVPLAQAFTSSHLTYSNGLELVGGSTPKPPAYPLGFIFYYHFVTYK